MKTYLVAMACVVLMASNAAFAYTAAMGDFSRPGQYCTTSCNQYTNQCTTYCR